MTTQQDKMNSHVVETTAKSNKPQEGIDYYLENGLRVLTAHFHTNRGYCCGNGCRHCPFFPKHIKGNQNLR
jgi:hypothetical protein